MDAVCPARLKSILPALDHPTRDDFNVLFLMKNVCSNQITRELQDFTHIVITMIAINLFSFYDQNRITHNEITNLLNAKLPYMLDLKIVFSEIKKR